MFVRRFGSCKGSKGECIEKFWARERLWIIVNSICTGLGTIAGLYFGFEILSILVKFQRVFYLLFIIDLVLILWNGENKNSVLISCCIKKQIASLVLVTAARTILSSTLLLPLLLELTAMLLVCSCR